MHVLLDTNILLDVLHKRTPFYRTSAEVLNLCDKGEVVGYINLVTIANIHYISSKLVSKETSLKNIRTLMSFLTVCPCDNSVVIRALETNFGDFEDALQNFSATLIPAIETIITRNPKDFQASDLAIYSPAEFLAVLNTEK